MPELEPAPYEAMPLIDIHVNGVAKLLRGINAHKATGPDAIPAANFFPNDFSPGHYLVRWVRVKG